MLCGGVDKYTYEGLKLHGNINICLIGEPSTSKTQLLKYLYNLYKNSIYLNGRNLSTNNLTGDIIQDSNTGEFYIENSLLMLANNGICCIDEFNKINIKDQNTLNEIIDSQTISIIKSSLQINLMTDISFLIMLILFFVNIIKINLFILILILVLLLLIDLIYFLLQLMKKITIMII